MPEYVKINLSNRFGDIFIDNLKASANITLSYGNLKGENFLFSEFAENTIQLSYAKAIITNCSRTKIKMEYSKINITKSSDLFVNSKNSKLDISENNTIIITSKYDAVNIKNTASLKVNKGQSSRFNIENIYQNLAMNLQYGKFNIGNVHKTFDAINIKSEYATGKITLAENQAYHLTAQMQHCNLHYPKNMDIIENNTVNFSTQLKAKAGKPEPNKGIINIASKHGDINVF